MAYFKGPEKYHASYGIQIKSIDLSKINNKNMNLVELDLIKCSSLVRINETASKVRGNLTKIVLMIDNRLNYFKGNNHLLCCL